MVTLLVHCYTLRMGSVGCSNIWRPKNRTIPPPLTTGGFLMILTSASTSITTVGHAAPCLDAKSKYILGIRVVPKLRLLAVCKVALALTIG